MSRTVTVNIDVAADSSGVTRLNSKVADLDENTKKAENTAREGFQGMGGAADVFLGEMAVEAVTQVVGQLKQMATQAIQTGARFEQSMADVQAITGLSSEKIEQLGKAARETSVETGRSASEVGKAYKLLASNIEGSAGRSVHSLRSMGKEVVTLSQAAGVDLKTATDTVAQTINQFGLEAAESGRVVNVLAAGAKEGAAEVGQLSETLKTAGTSASGAGVSLEETTAAAEVMAQSGIKGAEAGTALRNVMTILQTESEKLAKNGIKDVNLAQDGLAATMQKLTPLLDDATARTEIFGRENQNAASVLIRNAQSVDKMTQAVTDTNTAQKQAATQMDTFQGVMSKLTATLDQLEIAFFKAVGPELKQLIREAITAVKGFQDEFRTFFEVLVETTGPALGVVEEIFSTVFQNIGDITFNVITGLPELIWIALKSGMRRVKAFADFFRRRLERIGQRAKSLGNILMGALTMDRQQFKKGLAGIQKELVNEGKSLVQLGKELGASWGKQFNQMAEVALGDIDTSGIQQKIQRFQRKLRRAQQAGAGGGGGAGGQQQGGSLGQSGSPQRVQTAQKIEKAERSLTNTVKQSAIERISMAQKEKAAQVKAAQQKKEAKEAEQEAHEKAMKQQIMSSRRSISTAKGAAKAIIQNVKQKIKAKIAESIAKAIASEASKGWVALVTAPLLAAGMNALFDRLVPSFASGGEIRGPGGPTDDQVPIMASDREYIINAESAQAAPNLIRKINEDPQAARQMEEDGRAVAPPRSVTAPSGRGGGGGGSSKAAEKALAGVEAAVREQTEQMKQMDIDVRNLDEKLERFRNQESEKGV